MLTISPVKLAVVLEYLQKGGKVVTDGRTYVWLHNEVVRETETHEWRIDGLAVEGVSMNGTTGEENPHYMGMNNMPIEWLFKLIQLIPSDNYREICEELKKIREREEHEKK